MSLTVSNPLPRLLGTGHVQDNVSFPVTRTLWHRAWDVPTDTSIQSICAKIAWLVFPIIFAIAITEGVVSVGRKLWGVRDQTSSQRLVDIFPRVNESACPATRGIRTVHLERGSCQYDIAPSVNDPRSHRPPACTFHAIRAIFRITRDFDIWAERIAAQDVPALSKMQQETIEQGLSSYRQAVLLDHAFEQGADLENIRNRYPQFFRGILHFDDTNQEMHPVPERTHAIVEQLYAGTADNNFAWIKTANEESFAVVYCNGRAIVFDSHKNAISLICGKEELKGFLRAKLAPFSQLQGGIDLNAFAYAIGRC